MQPGRLERGTVPVRAQAAKSRCPQSQPGTPGGFLQRSLLPAISNRECSDPPRTRTWNLQLRGPTPYPLGQRTSEMPRGS